MSVRQVFSFSGTTGGTNNRFSPLTADMSFSTEPSATQPWCVNGRFENFRVVLGAAPGAGESITLAVRKNGVDTALAIVISGLETSGVSTESMTVVDGDLLSMHYTESTSTIPSIDARYTIEFVSDTVGESGYACSRSPITSGRNIPAFRPNVWEISADTIVNSVAAAPGTITKVAVILDSAPDPGGGDGFTFQISLNGVLQGDTAFDVLGNDTEGSFVFSKAVVPGDQVTISAEPVGSPGAHQASVAVRFLADVDGESQWCGSNQNPPGSTDGTEYSFLTSEPAGNVWATDENTRENIGGVSSFLLRGMQLRCDAPGVGDAWTFTVRTNQATVAGAPFVTLSGLDEYGSDAVGELDVTIDDEVSLQCDPSGSPPLNGTRACWGLIQYALGDPLTPEEVNGTIGPIAWIEMRRRVP